MRSRAHFKSHPIHPMLVSFPISFLSAALAADLIGVIFSRPEWWSAGSALALAGIISGVLAGVPGIVDYVYVVPPKSSGKQRATRHMLVNSTALVLFAGAWILRPEKAFPLPWLPLLLEAGGVGLVLFGGWLGGTLAFRNQIGVDHRYAEAGKWKEERLEANPSGSVVAARADELKPNQMKLLRVGDRRIVLARTEDGYVAFDDRCPHKGGSLAGGLIACGTVTCPWHGSQFDVRDGKLKSGPAKAGIMTHVIEQQGSEVRLQLRPDDRR
jgi:nitrite reductase/ring-hydroxylating ferredoxin subunit/uncharacterized membrane protein